MAAWLGSALLAPQLLQMEDFQKLGWADRFPWQGEEHQQAIQNGLYCRQRNIAFPIRIGRTGIGNAEGVPVDFE